LASALRACGTGWTNAGARSRVLSATARLAEAEGDTTQADTGYRDALGVALDNRIFPAAAEAAVGLAALAMTAGAPERAGHLLGLATVLRGTEATPEPEAADVVAAAPDPAVVTTAHDRAAALPYEEALAFLRAAVAP
jgi:hypothetical protein